MKIYACHKHIKPCHAFSSENKSEKYNIFGKEPLHENKNRTGNMPEIYRRKDRKSTRLNSSHL